jgi:ABC-2 type transport system ATP-binding protein
MDDVHAPAISAAGLGKTYPGGVEAVRGISFDVARGEVFGLLGPNGAGKSTTVGMLTTAILPTAGTARVAGFDVAADPLAARLVSSVVFQESVLDGSLSGRRNLELHARLWRVEAAAERIAEIAEAMGIGDLLERPASTYSGGQKRRLEIARALVSAPELLFLDEPTVGLDPRIRAELLDVIAGLRDRSETTILLTTHYLDEAERLCDRVAVVHEGRIVALGTPSALRAALGDEIVEIRLGGRADAALRTLRAEGVANEDAFSVGATVILPLHERPSAEAVAAIAAAGISPVAVATREPTLDDVYLRLTGKEMR